MLHNWIGAAARKWMRGLGLGWEWGLGKRATGVLHDAATERRSDEGEGRKGTVAGRCGKVRGGGFVSLARNTWRKCKCCRRAGLRGRALGLFGFVLAVASGQWSVVSGRDAF